jgi:hypothetical protein
MIKMVRSTERSESHCGRAIVFALIGGTMFSVLLMDSPRSAQAGQIPASVGPQAPDSNPFPRSVGKQSGRPPETPGPTEAIPTLHPESTVTRPARTDTQKDALLKSNLKDMKKHASQLAELAQSLQKRVNQTSEDVLSLDIIKKADAIEKLAKKIKDEAKGPY